MTSIHQAKKHLSNDSILAPIINRLELIPSDLSNDVYERLIKAIIYQQLSGKAAGTIHSRFLALFPDEYPNPEQLLDFDITDLRAVGLSNQKANYVQNVAVFFTENKLHHQDWSKLSDETILSQLTSIKGVGVWTVQMILMFTLGRIDILPTGDLAIQQAMCRLYKLKGKGKKLAQQMEKKAKKWSPYRSLACQYLWLWYDEQKSIKK